MVETIKLTNSTISARVFELEKRIFDFYEHDVSQTSGRHPILAKIMVCIFIHKSLTQKDLQLLTNHSAGAISQFLRQLVEIDMIKKQLLPKSHEYIYYVDELPYLSAKFMTAIGDKFYSRAEEIIALNSWLQQISVNFKKKLQNDIDSDINLQKIGARIDQLSKTINRILPIVQMYPIIQEMIEIELNKVFPDYRKTSR